MNPHKHKVIQMKKFLLAGLFIPFLFSACSNANTKLIQDDPDAELCLLEKDSGFELLVFYTCQSDGLELLEAECSVDVTDNLLEATSSFEYEVHEIARGACRQYQVTCPLPALPDGEYTIIHGDSQRTFGIPSDTNLDCETYADSQSS